MPFEYFNAGVKGPFTSNPAPATLARGMVDQSGCTMGPLQTGGKKTRRRRRQRRRFTVSYCPGVNLGTARPSPYWPPPTQ